MFLRRNGKATVFDPFVYNSSEKLLVLREQIRRQSLKSCESGVIWQHEHLNSKTDSRSKIKKITNIYFKKEAILILPIDQNESKF